MYIPDISQNSYFSPSQLVIRIVAFYPKSQSNASSDGGFVTFLAEDFGLVLLSFNLGNLIQLAVLQRCFEVGG